MNPAVSFSFYCDDTINSWTLRIYWTAQLIGAVGGAWFAYLVLGEITSPTIENETIEWLLADLCGEVFKYKYKRLQAHFYLFSSFTFRSTNKLD